MSTITSRRRVGAGLAILAASVLTACASEASDPTGEIDGANATEAAGSPDDVDSPESTEPEEEVATLRVAQATENLSFLAVYATRANGFFEEENVKVDFTLFGSSGPDVQALLAGDVDIALTSGTVLMNAHEASSGRVVGFHNLLNNVNIDLVTTHDQMTAMGLSDDSSTEERVAALEGNTVGASRPGAVSWAVVEDVLSSGDLVAGENVELVGVGGAAAISAAIMQGQVAVGTLTPPLTQMAIDEGWGTMFLDPSSMYDEFLYQVAVTTDAATEEMPDALAAFSRALTRGAKWLESTESSEIASVVAEYFPDVDEDILVESVEAVRDRVPSDGQISETSFENASKLAANIGEVESSLEHDKATVYMLE